MAAGQMGATEMSNLLWKINRLRTMGLAEILYRVRQDIQAQKEKHGIGLAQPTLPVGETGRPWLNEPAHDFDTALYREAADRVLAGRYDVFALHNVELGFPPQWNHDPKTGIQAPLSFGKTLDYRDEQTVGDIKYLWEPNRHNELVTLAQAWHLTGEAKYSEGSRLLLDSWFEQCPYPLGANWISSLEHAVRLVNWSFAWHLLGGDASALFEGDAGQAFKHRWLEMIYRHCHFIAGHLSRFSSANNHLLGEYMGLLTGALAWPLWPESAGWRQRAQQEFENEALKQNFIDGVNREQALWYQHEVADMMLLSGLLCRANGIEFDQAFWQRLEVMLEFIAGLMDAGGNMPMIGDSDDAVMVRFSREPEFNAYQSLLATGAALFSREDFKAKAGRFDDKSRWLLGNEAARRFDALIAPAVESPRRYFPQGGYAVLGDHFGLPEEIRVVMDCAPLGYLSIAAHGHADALAFTLSVAGEELLIDPGTYAYHTGKQWRDYFRSTRAHNTVCVDGLDQSVMGGNFMWVKHAATQFETCELDVPQERVAGSHDGYLRLADPLRHRREVVFDKAAGTLSVLDTLECKKRHRVEIHWHCHEEAEVSLLNVGVEVARAKGKATLALGDNRFLPCLARGEEEPPLGWVSRNFDNKSPTTVVVWSGEIEGSCKLETKIQIMLR
ncbi:alginate lyase family protein [Methylicorpusculum sp.]|uniref:heparinase II/III family protein n=1 Tax=Methylicorpusculum sp. TaxID=2713644 RepID=UPI0027311EEE|nr:alginate lyase family protein [Methylicorpusculum sp.]